MSPRLLFCATLALTSCRTTPERESKVIIPGAASEGVVLYGVAKKKCPTADLGVPGVGELPLRVRGPGAEASTGPPPLLVLIGVGMVLGRRPRRWCRRRVG